MRVAALLPAATDIVFALGAGDQLVAATHACTLPATFTAIPRVTRSRIDASSATGIDDKVSELSEAGAPLFELDGAALASLRPDVILTQAVCEVCAVREEDARAVAARLSPPPRVVSLGARTIDGILEDCATVARALGMPEEGEELVTGLRSRMSTIHRTLKAAKAPRPGVLVLEWTDPPFSAGHWVPDAVRRAGGVEQFGESGQLSRRLTVDEINDRDPLVTIVAPCGYTLAQAQAELKQLRDADMLGWLFSRRAWVMDANRLLSSPGPGVVHGVEVLARILHPQLFGEPSTSDAVPLAP
jgi:iron complex transport system substrate-binding protein